MPMEHETSRVDGSHVTPEQRNAVDLLGNQVEHLLRQFQAGWKDQLSYVNIAVQVRWKGEEDDA